MAGADGTPERVSRGMTEGPGFRVALSEGRGVSSPSATAIRLITSTLFTNPNGIPIFIVADISV